MMEGASSGAWRLIKIGTALMLVAILYNFFGVTVSLGWKILGLLVFFTGGLMAAFGLCLLTSDPDSWAKPISLTLTLLGVILLAAVQFDDERKTLLTYSMPGLEASLADARRKVESYRVRLGDDPAKFEELNDIDNQLLVLSAYKHMHYFCFADIGTLAEQLRYAPKVRVDVDDPLLSGNDFDDIKEIAQASAIAGLQKHRGCEGLKEVASWFRHENKNSDPELLRAIANGTATDADFAVLFQAAPRVSRQMAEHVQNAAPPKYPPELNQPSFVAPTDNMKMRREAERELADRQTERDEARRQLDELDDGKASPGVIIAETINLAFWTFFLVLAVSVDAATWLHQRIYPKPANVS